MRTWVATRRRCDSSDRFGPRSFCLPRNVDYGVSVEGNHDPEGVLLPVRLAMDTWIEPDYSEEDARGQAPAILSATATASALSPSPASL